jgi:hypothetical protein
MGYALITQACVSIGLSLFAKFHFPQSGEAIFTTIAASTIFYELFGPMALLYALLKAGDLTYGE